MRIKQLNEVGDIGAEKGSRSWALAVRDQLNSVLHQAEFSSKAAKGFFHALKETDGWRQLNDDAGCGFMSFEQFCCFRKPFGLGYDITHIEHIIHEREEVEAKEVLRKAPPLAKHGECGNGRSSRGSLLTSTRGETSEYLAARLKRDRPDICARIEAGEFKSIKAAARAAGIIKSKTPLQQLQHWWKKANPEERKAFLGEVTT